MYPVQVCLSVWLRGEAEDTENGWIEKIKHIPPAAEASARSLCFHFRQEFQSWNYFFFPSPKQFGGGIAPRPFAPSSQRVRNTHSAATDCVEASLCQSCTSNTSWLSSSVRARTHTRAEAAPTRLLAKDCRPRTPCALLPLQLQLTDCVSLIVPGCQAERVRENERETSLMRACTPVWTSPPSTNCSVRHLRQEQQGRCFFRALHDADACRCLLQAFGPCPKTKKGSFKDLAVLDVSFFHVF